MKNLFYLFFISVLICGCTSYQMTSVSIENAVNTGWVKTESKNGEVRHLENIVYENGGYYGYYKGSKLLINNPDSRSYYLTTSKLKRIEPYRAWIYSFDNSTKQGILLQVTDSSVFIVPVIHKTEDGEFFVHSATIIEEIMVKNIRTISIRKDGKIGKAAGTGLLLGAVSGFFIGFAVIGEGYPFSAAASGGIMAVFGGAIGASIGALTKAFKHNYRINGKENYFVNYKFRLRQKALVQN